MGSNEDIRHPEERMIPAQDQAEEPSAISRIMNEHGLFILELRDKTSAKVQDELHLMRLHE